MSYAIRQMTMDDYEEAHGLWQRSAGMSLDEGDSREGIALYLGRNEGFCFVATSQGRIVGTALCGHEGRRGILRHLAVDAAFRGQGLARALVRRCLDALAEAGIGKCNTFVLDSNVEGLRFWAHMGWYVLDDNYRTVQTPTEAQSGGSPGEIA